MLMGLVQPIVAILRIQMTITFKLPKLRVQMIRKTQSLTDKGKNLENSKNVNREIDGWSKICWRQGQHEIFKLQGKRHQLLWMTQSIFVAAMKTKKLVPLLQLNLVMSLVHWVGKGGKSQNSFGKLLDSHPLKLDPWSQQLIHME